MRFTTKAVTLGALILSCGGATAAPTYGAGSTLHNPRIAAPAPRTPTYQQAPPARQAPIGQPYWGDRSMRSTGFAPSGVAPSPGYRPPQTGSGSKSLGCVSAGLTAAGVAALGSKNINVARGAFAAGCAYGQ
jgi:hypothetical protein